MEQLLPSYLSSQYHTPLKINMKSPWWCWDRFRASLAGPVVIALTSPERGDHSPVNSTVVWKLSAIFTYHNKPWNPQLEHKDMVYILTFMPVTDNFRNLCPPFRVFFFVCFFAIPQSSKPSIPQWFLGLSRGVRTGISFSMGAYPYVGMLGSFGKCLSKANNVPWHWKMEIIVWSSSCD